MIFSIPLDVIILCGKGIKYLQSSRADYAWKLDRAVWISVKFRRPDFHNDNLFHLAWKTTIHIAERDCCDCAVLCRM